ncbi:MAG: hypothetical protein Q7T55_11815, partial [Solirubrobacteraceae bacterium]|nr:hypothetical protein [Solirubrobacteraceae bacterium]
MHGTWGDPIQGKAFLEAVTRDPDALRTALRARFGDIAELDWLGADDHVRRTVAFDVYEIDA